MAKLLHTGSILVPAYNEEVTVKDTVTSLLNLDYKLYEIIVIDDGSKDKTSQVLIDAFHMERVERPIRHLIQCQPEEEIYECPNQKSAHYFDPQEEWRKSRQLKCRNQCSQVSLVYLYGCGLYFTA